MALIKCEVCEKGNVEESVKKGVCIDCYKEISDRIKNKNKVLSELKDDEISEKNYISISQDDNIKEYTSNTENGIAKMFKIIAIFYLILGFVIGIIISISAERISYMFVGIISGISFSIICLAVSEVIQLLEDIKNK